MLKSLETKNGVLPLPVFLPDGTRGIVRAIDSNDVNNCKVEGIVVNTLHLSSHPGTTVVSEMGGIHKFMSWDKPVISDSGGFQVFSLIQESKKLGSISSNGFSYRFEKTQEKKNLTPEKCIQKQFQIGSDILYCLDHCTHHEWDEDLQKQSIKNTIKWAKRCKDEFDKYIEKLDKNKRPLLFAVIQGGNNKELRKECAESLLEIGFDGFGFGGWPINDKGEIVEMVQYVSELVPDNFPKHALGIGKPENIMKAFKHGYNIFDCVIPTRDARQMRLYYQTDNININFPENKFYQYLYMQDKKFARDKNPIDENCDCMTCQNYTRAYLYHLFRINDHLAYRLATIHNLRFYTKIFEYLKLHSNRS